MQVKLKYNTHIAASQSKISAAIEPNFRIEDSARMESLRLKKRYPKIILEN